MQNLINLKDDNILRKDFISGINGLRELIKTNVQPKSVNNKQINGYNLISLAESYTSSINNGGMPTLQTAWN